MVILPRVFAPAAQLGVGASFLAGAPMTSTELDDDKTDRADQRDGTARLARSRERGRVRAILFSDAGKADPARAFGIAIGTSLPRVQAIEALAGILSVEALMSAPPARDSLRNRMANVSGEVIPLRRHEGEIDVSRQP